MTLKLFLAVLVASAFCIHPAKAEPTKVYVDPALIIDESLSPGTQFSIAIAVDYVEELWGYQIEMSFNASILRGVEYVDGGFIGSAGGTVFFAAGRGFDNAKGELNLFAGFLFPKEGFPTGGGTLAIITFEVIGIGVSPLALGIYTGLANKTGGWELGPDWVPIYKRINPSVFADGYFDNTHNLTPIEVTQQLIEVIDTWNLPKGTENGFTSKLEATLHLLALGNENGATRRLVAFMNQVEALRGKKLTSGQADYLTSEARRIMNLISR